jgi:hypothetical protein
LRYYKRTEVKEVGKCCKDIRPGVPTVPRVTDLTSGRKENIICHNCNAHYYRGKFYTGPEWEAYVNG